MISSNYFCEIVAAQTSIMSFTTGTHLDSSYSEVRSFLAVPFLAPDLPGEIIKQPLKFWEAGGQDLLSIPYFLYFLAGMITKRRV